MIHDVSRLRRALFDKRSARLDITRSEAWILTGISRREEGLSQTELAKVLGLGKVATGEFVGDLEHKGLVIRRHRLSDRRAYCVQLTERGIKILSRISTIVTRMNAEIFAEFSPEGLARLEHDLKVIKLKLKLLVHKTAERSNRSSPGARCAARCRRATSRRGAR